jgi:hypothetical protein
MPMPLLPNVADFRRKLATFPLATYEAGETVLSAASTTGRLLILKEGAVAVLKEGVEIASVTEPGAASTVSETASNGCSAISSSTVPSPRDMSTAGSSDSASRCHALGVDLFLHQQGLDTTTPAGKAMFQMMGVSPSSSGR